LRRSLVIISQSAQANGLKDDIIVSNSSILAVPGNAKVLAKPALRAPQQQGTFCTGKGYRAGCTITSYYYFNGQRVAMRVQSDANPTGAVTWLHSDMLGSASLLTNANGSVVSQARYKPWGDTRSEWSVYLTDKKFTGQREESALGGIYDFNARFNSYIEYGAGGGRMYDPLIGRFISADIFITHLNNSVAYNRYVLVGNNLLHYTDPNKHC
jgi:RHS repeat-associated protein